MIFPIHHPKKIARRRPALEFRKGDDEKSPPDDEYWASIRNTMTEYIKICVWRTHVAKALLRIPQLDIANKNIACSSLYQEVFEIVKSIHEKNPVSSPRELPQQPSRSIEITDNEATVDSTQEENGETTEEQP